MKTYYTWFVNDINENDETAPLLDSIEQVLDAAMDSDNPERRIKIARVDVHEPNVYTLGFKPEVYEQDPTT